MAEEKKTIAVRLHFAVWDENAIRHEASPRVLDEKGLPLRTATGAEKLTGDPIVLSADLARKMIDEGKAEAAV